MIEAFLKEAMLEHLVTYATPLCLGLVLLPSLSGVNVLRDDVIDYKQMICSSTLLRNGNMVISTTVVDLKEQYTSCQVLWCFSTLDIESGYWQAELQGNNKKPEGVFSGKRPVASPG